MLPHERALRQNDLQEIEEERRLLFVGITRAKDELYLTESRVREVHGRPLHTIRSDFLLEMDLEVQPYSVLEAQQLDDFIDSPFSESDFNNQPEPVSHNRTGHVKSTTTTLPKLTTAAALLKGTPESVDVPTGFRPGMKVRHPQYGAGLVTKIGGYSKHRTVSVLFESRESTQTFIVSKCPLQIIGNG